MTKLADKLLAKVGKTRADFAGTSKVGRAFRREGVPRTEDFERILNLPRRDWNDGAAELADHLTRVYGRPAGVCKKDCVCRGRGTMSLRPVQAAALADLHDYGGLFAPISVGEGKTLMSFLAPKIVDAKRPMIFVPANLKQKTENEWWKLAVHWQLPEIAVETYERLGRASNANLLENRRPDLIFADEGHLLKNTKAACTRRFARYLSKNQCRLVIASGTLTTKSIREYWHLLRWTLGPNQMPIPKEWAEMMGWADCVDAKSENAQRTGPGCLIELCNEEERPHVEAGGELELEAVRRAYARRLSETPGIVSTVTSQYGGSLRITSEDLPGLEKLGEHYDRLRGEWQTPDGWDFSEAVELWRHARELVCGFYNVWDPRPPKLWMSRRRNWHQFVRQVLKHSKIYDTEFQIEGACASGKITAFIEVYEPNKFGVLEARDANVYQEWVDIRGTFKPNAVPVWVDDSALNYAASWLADNDGICWVEHPCFGEKLSKMTGVSYHGRKGLDAKGQLIDDMKGPRIASVAANSTGRNLQFAWSKSLVVSCLPNGKTIEQLLGRMHRDGQEADEVHYHFVIACKEQLEGFYKMLREAEYIEHSTRQPQKLLMADKDIASLEGLGSMGGSRWG